MTIYADPSPLTEEELVPICWAFSQVVDAINAYPNDMPREISDHIVEAGDNFHAHLDAVAGSQTTDTEPSPLTDAQLGIAQGVVLDLIELTEDAPFEVKFGLIGAWNALEHHLAYREGRNAKNIMGVDPTDAEAMALLFAELGPLQ